jgi:predicted  nucleic acid-binding Zn-ribbon protein
MDEQAVAQRFQRWFRWLRSSTPDRREQLQLLIGGVFYIILNLVALATLEWGKLKALIPLKVIMVLIEVGLGGAAIWLALSISDPARRGRLVFLFVLGRVTYAAIVYPLIVFLFYPAAQAAAQTFEVGFRALLFVFVFLPTIFASSLRIKSYFPELQEGNRVATFASAIISVIALPALVLSLGLVSSLRLAGQVNVEAQEAASRALTPLVLGFFAMFVAFVFSMFAAWSMRRQQLLRFKLVVARVNFRFACLCFGVGLAAFLFRVTQEGFWADFWDWVPKLLTMAALAAIQIPALTGWWRIQILNELRGDYSPAASSRIRRLMTRCVRNDFVAGPDGLALQRAVTGLDVMDAMPPGDTSAAVALKKDTVDVKYKPSGHETAVELLEPEDVKEDRRIIGSLKQDFAAAKRAFQLRRHGGDLRAQTRSLQHQIPSLYFALGTLADEKKIEHDPTSEYRATITGIHRELDELDGELKKQQDTLRELSSELDGKRTKHETAMAKAKNAYDAAATELSEARQKRADAERVVNQARSSIDRAEAGIAQKNQQLAATGEMALSAEAKKQVESQIRELESQIKTYRTEADKASTGLDKLRADEQEKAAKAAELSKKLDEARGKWGEIRGELEGKTGEVEQQKRDLERRTAEAHERLDDARREWGRALYNEARDRPELKKAIKPINENLAQQKQLEEELSTTFAERETLRPGVQRFTLIASVAGEVVILLALFIVLLVYAL